MLELLAQGLLIAMRRDVIPPQRRLYEGDRTIRRRRDDFIDPSDIPEWERR